MRKRNGFVSNSSTSSYICSVCSEPVEVDSSEFCNGWSGFICKGGHYVCYGCSEVGDDEDKIDLKKDEFTGEVIDWNAYDNVDKKYCPICRFEKISDKDEIGRASCR